MKIYSHVRLIAAEEKKVSELSDSSLRKIANDSKDSRSHQAKKELERRTGKSSSNNSSKNNKSDKSQEKSLDLMKSPVQKTDSALSDLARGYKKFDRWNTQRKIDKLDHEDKNDLRTDNWFFGPKESDFQGTKLERRKQLTDYINSRREAIRDEKKQLQEKLDRLNKELGDE